MDEICEYCGNPIPFRYRHTKIFCSVECAGKARRKHSVCEICGKTFRNNGGQNRYCSYECSHAPKSAVEANCLNCNKAFRVSKSRYERTGAQFCCIGCKSAYAWLTLPCHHCGKEFKIRRGNLAVKQRNNVLSYVFCSATCFNTWGRGANHANWQGGHRKWRGPNWQTQSKLTRERDNHTCQKCGVTEEQIGRPMDVHHIVPWRKFNNDWVKANDLSNLVSLCPSCHTASEPRLRRNRTTQQAQQ